MTPNQKDHLELWDKFYNENIGIYHECLNLENKETEEITKGLTRLLKERAELQTKFVEITLDFPRPLRIHYLMLCKDLVGHFKTKLKQRFDGKAEYPPIVSPLKTAMDLLHKKQRTKNNYLNN